LALLLGTFAGCSGGGGGGDSSPVANPDTYSSSAGQLTISRTSPGVLGNDSGSGITAELVSGPSTAASFALNPDGSFTYVHNSSSAATTDSFTYRAKNGTSTSNPTTVTLNITPPVAVADSFSMNAPGGLIINGNVLGNDTPATGLTVEQIGADPAQAASFSFNLANGTFSYQHNGGNAASVSFQYRSKVGAITSNTVTVTININQPPVAQNACPTIIDGQLSVTGNLAATDPNAGASAPTFEIVDQPRNGSVSTTPAGVFTYIPTATSSRRGMDTFTFRARDGSNSSLVSQPATVAILKDGKVRIMPLGDSITAGFGDATGAGYRKSLFQALETVVGSGRVDFVGSQTNGPSDFDNQHEGHGGWCDDNNPCGGGAFGNIKDAVQGFLDGAPADVVLLHTGTNDFSTDPSGVDGILTNINNWATANYPLTAFVARIIPAVDHTLAVNTFNNAVQTYATDRLKLRVPPMVDQQGELRLSGSGKEDWADPSLMFDNLHPNEAGYSKMANRWRNDLVASGILPICP
jgi:lysophospholipase L1-like esterase